MKNVKGNILSCSKHSDIIQRMESHSTDLPDKPFGLVDMADFLEKKKKKIYKPKLLQLVFGFFL